jgi:ElaB/YqjD/DUF883 family membrane-anchored ribosome-binding protein
MNHIENTEMAIDFMELENKSLDELRALIQKYKKANYNYKNDVIISGEIIHIFGDNDFIYLEGKKYFNVKLLNTYKKVLIKNYSQALDVLFEKRKEKSQEVKEKQKEKIKKTKQIYYEKNREKIMNTAKEHYQKKKEVIKEKIVCACGISYTFNNKSNHMNTLKHKNGLLQKSSDEP